MTNPFTTIVDASLVRRFLGELEPPSGIPPEAELVVFWWTREHGDCIECRNPAAYDVIDAYGPGKHMRTCSRCAALHAADGYRLVFLNAEPDDGTSGQDRESYTDDQDRDSYTVRNDDPREEV